MAISYGLGLKMLFLAGMANIVFFVLIFLSCRCMGGAKISERLFQDKRFQWFYRKHCFFWWGFIASVLIHTVLAFYLFGFGF